VAKAEARPPVKRDLQAKAEVRVKPEVRPESGCRQAAPEQNRAKAAAGQPTAEAPAAVRVCGFPRAALRCQAAVLLGLRAAWCFQLEAFREAVEVREVPAARARAVEVREAGAEVAELGDGDPVEVREAGAEVAELGDGDPVEADPAAARVPAEVRAVAVRAVRAVRERLAAKAEVRAKR